MAERSRYLLLGVLLALSACSESIEVLGPARAGSTVEDAGRDASDPPSPPMGQCGGCEALELCAFDQCVATPGITSLDAHLDHTCMVRDARAFCWGRNDDGQLGVGDQTERLSPARIGTDNDWLQITVGEEHSCGIRAPGVLYCWGGNDAAQLGGGDTDARTEPTHVVGERLWRSVACGGESCCAIDASDHLYCWGDNSEGKLGQLDGPSAPDAAEPKRVDDTSWRRVDVGQGHVCAIRAAGTLHCWGRNMKGELGLGPSPGQVRGTTQVGVASDWIDVSASQHSSCGVRANGALFCWGYNTSFEVGSPTLEEHVETPRQVGSDTDWVAVGTGWFHTCALKGVGALFCWGRAIEGQLAQGGGDPVEPPTKVVSALFAPRFALGNFHTCGETTEGTLQCWGANDSGELGVGDTERRYEPATIP